MATGRMLQKRISNSRKMSLLSSDGARLLYTWMLAHLDVNGCFYADPVLVNNLVLTRLGKNAKDVQKWLEEMEEVGLIIRYESNGEMYLIYPDFFEKQKGLRPDREGNSDIPQPTPEQLRINAGVNREEGQPLLRSNSPISIREAEEEAEEKGNRQNTPECPHREIIDLYHHTLPSLPKVIDWTPARASMLRTRWKEKPERQSLEWWKAFFESISESDFLMGRTNGNNGRKPFKADMEWIVRPQNMVKILEGKYSNDSNSEGIDWSKL